MLFFALITSSQIVYLMTFGTSFYGATICHYQYTLNGIEKFNWQCFKILLSFSQFPMCHICTHSVKIFNLPIASIQHLHVYINKVTICHQFQFPRFFVGANLVTTWFCITLHVLMFCLLWLHLGSASTLTKQINNFSQNQFIF